MRYFTLIFCLLLFCCHSPNQSTKEKSKLSNEIKTVEIDKDTNIYGVSIKSKIENIRILIECFKNHDVEGVSKLVKYPVARDFPIPPINNAIDFQNRFEQIFDSYLLEPIINSEVVDWHEDDFGIWLFCIRPDNSWDRIMKLGHEGLIEEIRHLSKSEKVYRELLISKEKLKLHKSLRIYEEPYLKIKTKDYLVRIDKMKNETYRYASWKIGKQESFKPDLIIGNGTLQL